MSKLVPRLSSNLALCGSFDSFAATSKCCIGMVWINRVHTMPIQASNRLFAHIFQQKRSPYVTFHFNISLDSQKRGYRI